MKGTEDVANELDHPPPRQRCCKAGATIFGWISRFWTMYIDVDPVWLKEVRGHLITAATLTATMSYQSVLSPPGGFWQDTNSGPNPSDEHTAGHAILDNMAGSSAYLVLNSLVLGGSLFTIMLALTGFPTTNKLLTWLLVFTVYFTISCMAAAYLIAVSLVCPGKIPLDIVNGLLHGWVVLCTIIVSLHLVRIFVWLGIKLVKLVKACCSCWRPTPRAYHKYTGEVNLARRP